MKVKKDISKLNLTDIDLGNTKIFINQSLCPYYKIYHSLNMAYLNYAAKYYGFYGKK